MRAKLCEAREGWVGTGGLVTPLKIAVGRESETRVYKKWSGGVRRATTLCRMSAGRGASCIGAGYLIPRASSGGRNRDWQRRSDRLRQSRRGGLLRRRREVKCAAGVAGMVTASAGSGLVVPFVLYIKFM